MGKLSRGTKGRKGNLKIGKCKLSQTSVIYFCASSHTKITCFFLIIKQTSLTFFLMMKFHDFNKHTSILFTECGFPLSQACIQYIVLLIQCTVNNLFGR